MGHIFEVKEYLDAEERSRFDRLNVVVTLKNVALGAVWQRSIANFSGQLAGFFEHGIFHGISTWANK